MYEWLIKVSGWFEPILKALIGFALIKYIILDW